jgi:aerobic carbon-monoxide dehydrogenase medium subunit
MKPAKFDYVRPATLPEALQLLTEAPAAKVLAGGQTLGPMLNLRLAQPELLIDISRIAELAEVAEDAESLRLGAIVTHAAIEDGRVNDPTSGYLRSIAAGIGYRAIRTRGTIGGSLAHADPAADWLAALTALAADLILATPRGARRLPLVGFVQGAMETALKADELIASVAIPKYSPRARFGYHKISRKRGEFADAIGASMADPERDIQRLVASTVAGAPIVLEANCDRLATAPTVAELGERLQAAGFVGDAYETRLRAVALRRAWQAMAAP